MTPNVCYIITIRGHVLDVKKGYSLEFNRMFQQQKDNLKNSQ